jgi:hypothetical protein
MTLPSSDGRRRSLLEQLAECHARDLKILAALLDTPENSQKRKGARNLWIRQYGDDLDDLPLPVKATKIATDWKRYLLSQRWQKERLAQLLPPGIGFPFWYLHVISKLNGEEALCEKQVLNILK